MNPPRSMGLSWAVAVLCAFTASCGPVVETVVTRGERTLQPAGRPPASGPLAIVFCLDGAGYDQLMRAIRSGKAPHMTALLGKEQGNGLFEHGYSAPDAVTILPSSTVAAWSAIFTGRPPAWNGVPGDEWFDRRENRFYAPTPISVTETTDFNQALNGDLVGKQLRVPTLYEQLRLRSHVSMLMVYRGANLFTTVNPTAFAGLIGNLVKGTLSGEPLRKSISTTLDLASVPKLLEAIAEHGLPDLQIVYFPGIDLFTHASPDPLESQVAYLEDHIDGAVGQVLEGYRQMGALPETYVIFIADHGHTPVLNDARHRLGPEARGTPFALLGATGFRTRKRSLTLAPSDQDYQAVMADQGFMAYLYLADRSTCPNTGDRCVWEKPPRFREDVMPVVRAFYENNQTGDPTPQLKGTIDLIFARRPRPPGTGAAAFEVFDGKGLVSIEDYLERHPRPDLQSLEERMRWLGEGPYGYLAGDIVLLAKASMALPVQDRYYFAAATHYSWHGSANIPDGHIPFIVAKEGGSGRLLRDTVNHIRRKRLSGMDLTPLVRALLGR